MAEFEIKVAELDAGGKDYVFPIRSSWLAGELARLGDAAEGLTAPAEEGRLELLADKSGEDVIVRGHIRGGLVAVCSRCLGPAPIAVDSELAMLLCARGKGIRPQPGEEDLTPDEIDREFYTGDTIVLDDAVREHLLLEVPMQPLCAESCQAPAVPEAVRGPADLASEPGKKPALSPLAKALVEKGLAQLEPPQKPVEKAANGPEARAAQPQKKTKRAR